MRWLLLVSTVFAFVLCFTREGPAAMGWWLLLGMLGVVASTLAFAHERISASARDESLSEYELQQLRQRHSPANHDSSTYER